VFQHENCPACTTAKVNLLPTLSGSQVKPSSIDDELSWIYVVHIGRLTFEERYFTLVVDANTLYRHVFLNKTKTELLTNLTSLVCDYLRHGWTIQKIRYDTGRVGNSREIATYLSSQSSFVELAPVDNQNQNPVERSIQTHFKSVNSILVDQRHQFHALWGHGLLFHVSTIVAHQILVLMDMLLNNYILSGL